MTRSPFTRIPWLRWLVILGLALPLLAACGGGTPSEPTPTPTNPLIVYPGEIGYQLNPAYTPDNKLPMFVETGFVDPGGKINPETQKKDAVAVVGEAEIGFFQGVLKVPGTYPHIPKFAMKLERAAVVPQDFIGVYSADGENYEYKLPGTYPIRETDVVFVPISLLTYRTVSPDLLEQGKGCSSPYRFLCAASLSDMKVASGAITATLDVDVIFQFVTTPIDIAAPRLSHMGSITNTVETLMISPLRGSRAITAKFSVEGLESGSDWPELEKTVHTLLLDKTKDSPISVISVIVRRVTVGDKAWHDSRQAQLQAQESAKQEGILAGIRLINQQRLLEIQAAQGKFDREQAELDFQARLARLKTLIDTVGGNPELLRQALESGILNQGASTTIATPTATP